MAIVTSSLIQTLRTGYSKAFQEALAKAPTQWASVATVSYTHLDVYKRQLLLCSSPGIPLSGIP